MLLGVTRSQAEETFWPGYCRNLGHRRGTCSSAFFKVKELLDFWWRLTFMRVRRGQRRLPLINFISWIPHVEHNKYSVFVKVKGHFVAVRSNYSKVTNFSPDNYRKFFTATTHVLLPGVIKFHTLILSWMFVKINRVEDKDIVIYNLCPVEWWHILPNFNV